MKFEFILLAVVLALLVSSCAQRVDRWYCDETLVMFNYCR